LKCPFCAQLGDRVVDSREVRDGSVIRRRRECLACSRRFTSYERIEELPQMVVKKDGRRERFDRQKLMSGLLKACEKRPVSVSALEEVIDGVENLLADSPEREATSREIGDHVMARLRDLDQVAYVRFASVYRHFEDIQALMQELQDLLKKK
jgi:transcriptional repressor NrdR